MGKVVSISTIKTQKRDTEYWMTKTPQERIDTIEFLRQQYIQYTNAEQRLQRVCRIIRKK